MSRTRSATCRNPNMCFLHLENKPISFPIQGKIPKCMQHYKDTDSYGAVKPQLKEKTVDVNVDVDGFCHGKALLKRARICDFVIRRDPSAFLESTDRTRVDTQDSRHLCASWMVR